MAHLTRAWQMLLKGIREAELCRPMPLLAAEMVLIRLAHAVEVPSGEDLVRLAQQEPPAEKSVSDARYGAATEARSTAGGKHGLAGHEDRTSAPHGAN